MTNFETSFETNLKTNFKAKVPREPSQVSSRCEQLLRSESDNLNEEGSGTS